MFFSHFEIFLQTYQRRKADCSQGTYQLQKEDRRDDTYQLQKAMTSVRENKCNSWKPEIITQRMNDIIQGRHKSCEG